MVGLSHALIGASSGLITVSVFQTEINQTLPIAALIGAGAGLMPDLDAKVSTVSIFADRRLKARFARQNFTRKQRTRFPEMFIYMSLYIIEATIGAALMIASFMFQALSSHRGISHSLVFATFLYTVLLTISVIFSFKLIYSLIFFAGYVSHILADSMTINGVAMFNPVSKKTYHLLPKKARISTGKSTLEIWLVIYSIALASGVMLIKILLS